jgi:Holliday junction resolvase
VKLTRYLSKNEGGKKVSEGSSSSRKGDLAEYYAVTWLWDNGYEVFKNCGCSGDIDLVAIDNQGNVKFIDVKTRQAMGGGDKRTLQQKEKDVKLLVYDPISRKIKFVKHRGKE